MATLSYPEALAITLVTQDLSKHTWYELFNHLVVHCVEEGIHDPETAALTLLDWANSLND